MKRILIRWYLKLQAYRLSFQDLAEPRRSFERRPVSNQPADPDVKASVHI